MKGWYWFFPGNLDADISFVLVEEDIPQSKAIVKSENFDEIRQLYLTMLSAKIREMEEDLDNLEEQRDAWECLTEDEFHEDNKEIL